MEPSESAEPDASSNVMESTNALSSPEKNAIGKILPITNSGTVISTSVPWPSSALTIANQDWPTESHCIGIIVILSSAPTRKPSRNQMMLVVTKSPSESPITRSSSKG